MKKAPVGMVAVLSMHYSDSFGRKDFNGLVVHTLVQVIEENGWKGPDRISGCGIFRRSIYH